MFEQVFTVVFVTIFLLVVPVMGMGGFIMGMRLIKRVRVLEEQVRDLTRDRKQEVSAGKEA